MTGTLVESLRVIDGRGDRRFPPYIFVWPHGRPGCWCGQDHAAPLTCWNLVMN